MVDAAKTPAAADVVRRNKRTLMGVVTSRKMKKTITV